MDHLLCGIVAIICFFVSFPSLNPNLIRQFRSLQPKDPNNTSVMHCLSPQARIVISAVLSLLSAFTMHRMLMATDDWTNRSRLIIALICLCSAGCIDYTEHRIPNIISIIMCVSAIFLLAVGFFTKQDGAFSYIVGNVFSAAVCTLGLTIALLLSRGGVGVGDIKLIGSLSLLTGVYAICGTVFFSMILCSIVAIILLLMKKKSPSDGIPFGPFVLAGYMLSICFSIC